MPLKDKEARLAYQREWYHRPGHAEKVSAKVQARKKEHYRGVCVVCGGPTQGNEPKNIPVYCSKPACLSAQRRGGGKILPKRLRTRIVTLDTMMVPDRNKQTRNVPGLIGTDEAAKRLGVSRNTVTMHVRQRKLRAAFKHAAYGYYFQPEVVERHRLRRSGQNPFAGSLSDG